MDTQIVYIVTIYGCNSTPSDMWTPKSKIFVIRDGVPRVSEKGRQISIDEELMPGDIVTIEQSFF